jgi:hypothetical protein
MFTKTHVMRLLLLIMILGGFEMQAQFSETLKVKANTGTPVFSTLLKSGVKYRITVSGSYSIWPEYLGNGIDAAYIYDVPKSRIDNKLWPAEAYVDINSGDTITGIRLPAWVGSQRTFPGNPLERSLFPFYEFNLGKWTGFRVNGQPLLDIGHDSVNHQYQFVSVGTGNPLSFSIIDSVIQPPMEDVIASYSDNSGELTVSIEEMLPFNVNICSTNPILDNDKKMKGIKVDVSVLVPDPNTLKGQKNILFDKNQVAIYENGKFICPDTIYCNKTVEAISVAMVFDRTSSMFGEVSKKDSTLRKDAAVKSAKSFINTLGSSDQVLLLSFSNESDITLDQNWTTNKTVLQSVIDGYPARLQFSQTALHKALISAISRTQLIGNRIRAVVALTDGANKQEPLDENAVINALPASGDIPVFIIALGLDTIPNTTITNPTEKEIDSLKVADNIEGLKKMRRIAEVSKGKVFLVDQSNALDAIYAQISKGIREEECCTIEYAVEDCANNLADTVRTIMIYYPFEGGVSAKSTTYKTSCAKLFLGRNGNAPYTRSFVRSSNAKKTPISFTMKKSEQISIDIIDKSGKRISSVFEGFVEKGKQSLMLELPSLKSGSYTAVIFVKGKKLSQHEINIQE